MPALPAIPHESCPGQSSGNQTGTQPQSHQAQTCVLGVAKCLFTQNHLCNGSFGIHAHKEGKRSVIAPDQALTAGFQFQGSRSARRAAG